MDRYLITRIFVLWFLSLAIPVGAQEGQKKDGLYAELRQQIQTRVEKDKSSSWGITAPAEGLTTREDFQKKIAELNASSNAIEYLRHALEYLQRFEPTDDFAEILWRAGAYSEIIERQGATMLKTKITPFIINLLATLPEDDEFFLEGRFLAATHHNHQQEFAEEEEILRKILAREDLKPDFRFSAYERMGFNYELRERFADAAGWYLKSKEYVNDFPSSYESLIRAVYIYLESGKREDALDLLDFIRGTDKEKWSKTPTAYLIVPFLALSEEREAASAYWDASTVWWEDWKALRQDISFQPGDPDIRVPSIKNPQAFAQQMAESVKAGRSALFLDSLDILARALRWSPQYANDYGSAICFLGVRVFPGRADALRNHMIKVTDNFQTEDKSLKRYMTLYHALCLIDTGRHDEALVLIIEFKKTDTQADAISQGITRLWAAVSYTKGENMDEPALALETMLENPEAINRVQTVLALASLYRKMDRADDERLLLEKEMEHPGISVSDAAKRMLADRYNPLVREGVDASNFSVAVGDWLTKFKPAWFDICPPRGLEDKRLVDLEAVLRDGGNFTQEEMIKVNMFAATSAILPLALKQQAFRRAMTVLAVDARTHKEFREMIAGVIDNDLFPEELRQATLLFGVEQAIEHHQKGDLAYFLTHPVMDQSNERIATAMRLYGPYSQCDPRSAASLFEFHKLLTGEAIERPQLAVLFSIISRLLEIGALDEANKIYEGIGNWQLAPSAGQSTTDLKFLVLRSLKQAQRSVPFSESMIRLVKSHFDLESLEKPKSYATLRSLQNLDFLPRAEAQKVRLWQVREGDFPHNDPRFWLQFGDSLEQNEKSFEFSFQMIEKLLAEAEGDFEKSLSALSAPGLLDTDEVKLVERLYEIFAPYRDEEKYPLTYAAIRNLEIQTSLRRGEEVNITVLDSLNHPALRGSVPRTKIRYFQVKGKKAQLRALLESFPAEALVDLPMLSTSIPAMDAAGMKDEAELARASAQEKFPAMLASAWRSMNAGDAASVYALAELLGKPELVPAEFFVTLNAGIRNEQLNLTLRMSHSALNKDWQELEKVATVAVTKFPSFYHYYWYQAKARYYLGKKQEALVPLEIYTKYSKDEEEYPQALEWLQEIKGH
jgi:tetratricopeptide (TPR) repeat protein